MQLPEFETPEAIFSDYAYFSSYSDSWLDHARRYVEMMIEHFDISERHRVVEVASNDPVLSPTCGARLLPSFSSCRRQKPCLAGVIAICRPTKRANTGCYCDLSADNHGRTGRGRDR